MGLRVIAIDHGSKEAFVKEQGAEFFVDFTKVGELQRRLQRRS